MIELDRVGAVATLLLNRPEKLNALDTEAFERLEAHLDALEAQAGQVQCVLVRGAGPSFCAGADLSTASTALAETAIYKSRVLQRLASLPVPVVAVVQGHCVAGGLELALCADLIVAAESAQFRDAHGAHALVPAWGLSQRLPRRIGLAAAKHMVFTRRVLDSDEAVRVGLADLSCPDADLDSTVELLVQDIVAGSWFTHSQFKALVEDTDGLSLVAGLAHEHYRHPRRESDA